MSHRFPSPSEQGCGNIAPWRVLILGASTRAAAQAVVRAGGLPLCADGYADADLRDVAEVLTVGKSPEGLRAAAQRVPTEIPWMYTGGLENHRHLVAEVSRGVDGPRELWGNGADVLKCVRNPFRIAAALNRVGLPALEVRSRSNPPPGGDWLIKPRLGSGGRGVERWTGADSERVPQGCYFQQFKEGESISALYVASSVRSRLLGVSGQLIGSPSAPFGYAGSLTPQAVSEVCRSRLEQVGECVVSLCETIGGGLRGLFGIDFILADGVPWLTEVNPRWTASAELLELHLGQSLILVHRDACRGGDGTNVLESCTDGSDGSPTLVAGVANVSADAGSIRHGVLGKQVVYASASTVAGDATLWSHRPVFGSFPVVADIPEPGQRFLRGQPICTVFAQGESTDQCRSRLAERTDWFLSEYTSLLESP